MLSPGPVLALLIGWPVYQSLSSAREEAEARGLGDLLWDTQLEVPELGLYPLFLWGD